MKRFLIITTIALICLNLKSQDSTVFNNHGTIISVTPLKPFLNSRTIFSIDSRVNQYGFLGMNIHAYWNASSAITLLLYEPPSGIKAFVHFKKFNFLPGFHNSYIQYNLGGGYFTADVNYVSQEQGNLKLQKNFFALGGALNLGCTEQFKNIVFDFSLGLQSLSRLLPRTVSTNDRTYRRDVNDSWEFFSDNLRWKTYGPGSLLTASVSIGYVF
ncbi:MAG: hypothetical protein ACOC3T_02220 [Bacteroidota bacterium]